jgi:hypothetical protein
MSRRLAFVIAAALGLGGCCLGSGCYDVQAPMTALGHWDGLGPLPNPDHVKRAVVRKTSQTVASKDDHSPSEEELATLRPYSKEWGAVRDAIDRAADARLRKRLIICRNCMPPEQEDQTGSIAPR